jgi:hypothetical protein
MSIERSIHSQNVPTLEAQRSVWRPILTKYPAAPGTTMVSGPSSNARNCNLVEVIRTWSRSSSRIGGALPR